MTAQRNAYLFALLLTAGCLGGDPDAAPDSDSGGGKADDPYGDGGVCADEGRHQDGVCGIDCPEPDLDCFVLFDSDAEAATWFSAWEADVAAAEGRDPRPIVSASDPRHADMRAALDRGWASYRAVAPVGQLDRPPALIVLDSDEINAFAGILDRDVGKVGWAVVVNTAVLDGDVPEAELMGLVMHELEHAAQLHTVPGVADRLRRVYQVVAGEAEPFGSQQPDDPELARVLAAWRELAQAGGSWPLPELNGLPLGPQTTLALVLRRAQAEAVAADADACAGAVALEAEVTELVTAAFDPLDGELHLPAADLSALDQLSRDYLASLRDECLAGSDLDVIEVLAEIAGVPADALRESMGADELALIDGKHIVDQVTALSADAHRQMRAIEAALVEHTGAGLESLRYYSFEEAADDRSVPVLRAAALAGDGLADFFVNQALQAADVARCEGFIAAGEVPYGNLSDNHHGTCWRVWHVRELDAAADEAGAPVARRLPPAGRAELARRVESLRRNAWIPAPPPKPYTDCAAARRLGRRALSGE